MNLADCLSEIKDFRRPQGQRYGKTAMLLIIIMSMLRNKYGYREIGRFCKWNEQALLETFGFTNGKVPSYVSIRTFVLETDFVSIQDAFHKWAGNYVPIEQGEWIQIEGKSIRSTLSDYAAEYQNFVSLVSLFVNRREQILHVEKLENKKGNEARLVEDLLEVLDLKDAVFTLDALHCKKTPSKIAANRNHYAVKVKGNQPNLLSAVKQTVKEAAPIGCHLEEAIVRGRLEIRETFLYARQNNLAQGWGSIHRIAYVKRCFLSNRGEHKSESYYVSDLHTDDARHMAIGRRSHRGMENKLHHTKDVVMREDDECTKNKRAAANLALFRDFAFNILKTKNRSVKYACEIFANYNVKELLIILFRT